MSSVKPTFKLNGNILNPPKGWGELEVLATFPNGSIQANLSTSELEFNNEAAKYIRDWIAGGMTGATPGITEGIPFEMLLNDTTNNYEAFRGYLDLVNTFEEITPVQVQAGIKKDNGLNSLEERSKGVTASLLVDKGFITASDYANIEYLREKPFNFTELALLALTTFLLAKETAQLAKETAEQIANISAHTAGGVTGPVAGLGYSIAIIIINIIYAVILISTLIDLITDIVELVLPKVRIHKGMNYRTYLEKGADYLGYNFSSSITALDNIYLLPTKRVESNVLGSPVVANQVGAPSPIDPYYTYAELLSITNATFHSKIAITQQPNGRALNIEPLINDQFWLSQSGWTLPDVLNELKLYNAEEIPSRHLISFQQDTNDEWTLLEPDGFYFEAATQQIQTNVERYVGLTGLDETRIPFALASRKATLSDFEIQLAVVAGAADDLINTFGGNSNLQSQITSRIGLPRMTSYNVNVPKMIPLAPTSNGLRMPTNHQTVLSAGALWGRYHKDKSAVLTVNGDQNRGQKRKFRELKVPFGFSDFLKLIQNSYFTVPTSNGTATAKAEGIKWRFDEDYALLDGWVRMPYTKNLEHYYIESGTNGWY